MQEQNKQQTMFENFIDQVFEIEKKLEKIQETNSINRNINSIKELFANLNSYISSTETGGYIYHNPIGEPYPDTRIDCNATIAGEDSNNLFITEVIKPIIYYRKGDNNRIARKGVVVLTSKQ